LFTYFDTFQKAFFVAVAAVALAMHFVVAVAAAVARQFSLCSSLLLP